jgi:hypothetical protein
VALANLVCHFIVEPVLPVNVIVGGVLPLQIKLEALAILPATVSAST